MGAKQSITENEERLPITRISDFIIEHEQKAFPIQEYSKIAKHILKQLAYVDEPKQEQPKPDGKPFVTQIASIDEFLSKISEQVDITKICLVELHAALKMDNPSPVAGIILHRLETTKVPNFSYIFSDEQQMRKALNHLFCWMKFTFFIQNLDSWLLRVVADLQRKKKYSVLLDVSRKQIMQIACAMAIPITQKQAEPIFFTVLTSVQHTSIIFDKFRDKMALLLRAVRSNAALQQKLVDTVKALIDHFNTFPDHQDYSELENVIANEYSVSANSKQCLETTPWHDTSPGYHSYHYENARVGLENLGNTCYMNSILQALALTKHFRHEMLFIEIKSDLFELLQRLLALLLHSNRPALSPDMIHAAACPPTFHEGSQQDCSEFLGHLLESLHLHETHCYQNLPTDPLPNGCSSQGENSDSSSSNPPELHVDAAATTTPRTLVQKMFEGSILIVYKCHRCGTTSKQNDSFRDLHLSFPDTEIYSKYSIEDLLEYYCSIQRLDADKKFFCNICKMICNGDRLVNIVNPPRYLVLTLKYFKYDEKSNMRTKLTHKVKHSPKIWVKVLSADGQSEHFVQYRLYAAVVHSGDSMDSGHYCTYGSDHPDDGPWFKFDDSLVTECNITALKGLRSPNTPYVLFYERDDDNYNYPALAALPTRLRNYVDQENSRYEMEKRFRRLKLEAVNKYSDN